MKKIELLDCTLRDGGYVNDWEFGHDNIVILFERLVSSEVDYIEIGFMDDRRDADMNRSIAPGTAAMSKIYEGLDKKGAFVVGMIDYGTCDISLIQPQSETIMDGIRVIFKKQKMHEAIDYMKQIKALGYKVFCQAVSITSYNDEELAELIELVNDLDPYAFSLVDTYGLLHKEQLMHYYNFANIHLNEDIRLGYHAHNNFQLAFANCVELIETSDDSRTILIDGTLYGMGKSAGNAPVELLANYMNSHLDKHYHVNQLLEAIDVTIMDIYKRIPWGYNMKFFVSASNDCHPNYVTYLMDKKKLSMSSINHILAKLEGEKKLLYDQDYIESLYIQYQNRECDDTADFDVLKQQLTGKPILMLAPGKRIYSEKEKVDKYIAENKPVVIAINFIPSEYCVNYAFLSNSKRYVAQATKISKKDVKLIATSNVTKAEGCFDYVFSYSKLLDEEALIADNPMIMLIRLLRDMNVESIALAGFDGYEKTALPNYINANMEHTFSKELAHEINEDVKKGIIKLELTVPLVYVTTSLYER
ncbi:MAG: aldolase catalytic domain-containing protein [Lachnospiraceae bacterium]|nr:aldolase catalytic domain-containing protein [Lachnospiraceae bacterium]